MGKRYLSSDEIDVLLSKAYKMNPGKWVHHSYVVGDIARKIASDLGMDPDFAYACGCLHDIGRMYGFSYIKHILDGYRYFKDQYEDLAKICLTHSFPLKNRLTYGGKIDISKAEYDFIIKYIEDVEYDDYDLLIQLLDSLVTGDGMVLQEKRMIDVLMRYGVNEYTNKKLKRQMEIKEYFEKKLNKSIYSYSDDIIENTFK